jgi:hypothetical protein
MVHVALSKDATAASAASARTSDSRTAVRFNLRRVFGAITYTAIAAWALRSTNSNYEVYGSVASGVVWIALIVGAIVTPLLLLILSGRSIVRVWMLALLAFALSQTVLDRRLSALRTEIGRIIAYVDDFKLQHGLYPTDLSAYEFQRPDLAEYIEYRDAYPATSYEIRWHPIKREGIAHWYGADYGHYYEDD